MTRCAQDDAGSGGSSPHRGCHLFRHLFCHLLLVRRHGMARALRLHAFLVALCSIVPTFAHAEDLQALAAKLEQPNYPLRKEPAACSTLLRDLRKWEGIIVREPLVNTDALEDS